jgi:chromosome segregation ATPase
MSDDMKREIGDLKARATRYEADVRAFFKTASDIKSDLKGMKSDMQAVKSDMQAMKSDLQAVKSDLQAVKSDMQTMQGDLSGLPGMKADIQSMKETLHRVAVTTAQTSGGLAELKTYVHTNLVTKNEFRTEMDGFAGRIDDFRLHMAQQKERLDDLESKSKHS